MRLKPNEIIEKYTAYLVKINKEYLMLNISNLYPKTAISNKNKDAMVTILENNNQ